MNPAKEQFDRLDFLHAWLDGQEYKKAHEDLRNYYGQIATAFGLAFEVDLDHLAPEVDAFPDTALNDTFRQTVQARQACVSPFSYYILAPLSIKELYRSHGEGIKTSLETLIRQYDALLLDLLERILGIMATDFVSRDDLMRCGFPSGPEPNHIDYI